jgi:hypothetical protein
MISRRSAGVGIGLAVAVAVAVAISVSVSARQPAAGGSGDLSVTVKYQGKGPVGKGHEIGVFLFDNPDIGGPYRPIGVKVIETNGGTVHFTGVKASTVYVAVSYDSAGTYTEWKGPPPPGAPIAVYGVKGDPNEMARHGSPIKPAPVRTGPGAAIAITFDDAYPSK